MTSVLLTLGRCIAGLLDLLRTKGLWLASARYGYLYGALEPASPVYLARISPVSPPYLAHISPVPQVRSSPPLPLSASPRRRCTRAPPRC